MNQTDQIGQRGQQLIAGTSASVLADILRTLQRALLSGALQACSTPLRQLKRPLW